MPLDEQWNAHRRTGVDRSDGVPQISILDFSTAGLDHFAALTEIAVYGKLDGESVFLPAFLTEKHVLVLQLPFHAEGDIYNGAGIPGGGRSASGAVVQRDLPQEHNREVKSRSVMLRLISFFGRVDYILGIFYGSYLTYAGR